MAQVSLSELKQRQLPAQANTEVGFGSIDGFMALQRMANMFASSNLVPDDFKGNIGNAAIVLDMAFRMKANPLSIFQNLYLIHGRPSWSAQFLIATCNQCGRFSALRYKFQGEEGTDSWGCRATATEFSTGEKLEGPLVTIGIAKSEGWYNKNGSKWKSMPELMLRYRAASWFVRAFAPELAMGLPEKTELEDTVIDVTPEPVMTTSEVKEKTRRRKKDPEPAEVQVEPVEDATGDLKAGIMTCPLIAGAPVARRLAGFICLFCWAILPLPVVQGFYPTLFLIVAGAALTPITALILVLAHRKNYRAAQKLVKVAMFAGLVALLVSC